MNRNVFYLLVLVISLVLLSGCNTGSRTPSNESYDSEPVEPVSTEVDADNQSESNPLDHTSESAKAQNSELEDKSGDVIRIYLSADQTVSGASTKSIEQGIRVALNERNNKVHDIPVDLVLLDHRGSSPRAKQHLDEYINDDQALVIYSGLHSPPVLENRDFINENKILMLDPWAAAGPITRYPSEENWIFRLSVDDTKAGEFITNYAISEGFSNPYLILEDTGWGRSNQKTMTNALNKYELQPAGIASFNWSLGINQAKFHLRDAKSSGADVIFFVGNAPEGKVFAEAITLIDPSDRLPVRSHWGITGGDFQDVIGPDMREYIDLKFIQTSYSFMDKHNDDLTLNVLKEAYALFPGEITKPEDIEAPTGFIHGYDLTKLMLSALDQVDPRLSVPDKRDALRLALENMEKPVQGLIKTYDRPFSGYSNESPDAHEALGIDELRMAYYDDDNNIILVHE